MGVPVSQMWTVASYVIGQKLRGRKQFPVVLMGVEHWRGLIDWMSSSMLSDARIKESDIDMLTLTDDVDEVVELMVKARDAR